ncbi:MAG: TlpA family protein disulfide reductase [Myxococcales bacterium]|nr:TlpA family protein disulfide reductase [Myxococcales bacterium]
MSLVKRSFVLGVGAALLLALGACSSNDGNATPDGSTGDDAQSADQSCGDYVCGPFGTKQGDIIENLSFSGFRDPDDLCTAHVDKAHDLSKPVRFSLSEYYNGSTTCPDKQKKLLWVMMSAGWCGPCIDEIKSIMSQYKAGGLDPRLEVMDMLFETDTRAPTTEEFARKWQKDLGITFPLAMDPEFQMQKYFQRNAVPVNMLIDLRTMRIHFFQTGVSLSRVGQEMVAFFSRLDNGN